MSEILKCFDTVTRAENKPIEGQFMLNVWQMPGAVNVLNALNVSMMVDISL